MGIPKFFRWLSERYPMCSQLIGESAIPEFDNLYLDMNGIIHHCTHGNNDSVHFRMSLEQQFSMIFLYIEHLFNKIRPQKIFFMAVDGVAPRAKINQQRSRRFRTAAEAEEKIKKALAKGEVLPEQEAFDSNCITPGTEFMTMLSQHLHYFIRKKVANDVQWRNCKIILSGHEVPGEGEHKIMEYIRLARSQPGYDPNTRHCLYGLDADLIMLGLASHDPHFCLLREEVVFGGSKQKKSSITNPESQKFYLLHLCLLREYLDIEFAVLKTGNALSFGYDLERILDDFILMSLFIGNDFLPHLPNFHINEGALAMMFECYKICLPKMKDYMNDGGRINMDSVEILLQALSEREVRLFADEQESQGQSDSRFANRNNRHLKTKEKSITPEQKKIVEMAKHFLSNGDISEIIVPSELSEDERVFVMRVVKELGLRYTTMENDGILSLVIQKPEIDEDDEEMEESSLAQQRVIKKYDALPVVETTSAEVRKKQFFEYRANYYRNKLNIDLHSTTDMGRFKGSYLQGLQWVMDYYYNGVQSWSWFFPYHYAPMLSDLLPNLKESYEAMAKFQIGTPFRPFEQLMGVMPARSRNLLPEAYRDLMTDVNSPILDFYPEKFECDLNGKKNEWEAVVKIPFVDEKRLLEAMKTREHLLTLAEKNRNSFGKSWIFIFDKSLAESRYPSPLQGVFPDLAGCPVRVDEYFLPVLSVDIALRKGRISGTFYGADSLAGFPSLYLLPHHAHIGRHGVKVFQAESRSDTVIVTLDNTKSESNHTLIAQEYLRKRVYVGWPFVTEAVIVGFTDSLFKYHIDPSTRISPFFPDSNPLAANAVVAAPLKQREQEEFIADAEYAQERYSHRSGVLIGDIELFARVCTLKGMRRLDNGAVVKDFSDLKDAISVPFQTIVHTVKHEDARFVEKPAPPIDVDFPLGTKGFYLGAGASYGSTIEVTGYAPNRKSLNIKIFSNSLDESSFGGKLRERSLNSELYHSLPLVAKKLSTSSMVISKITSSVFIRFNDMLIDFGLHFKFEGKQLKVPGIAKRNDNGWQFSDTAVAILQEYQKRFPELFEATSKSRGADISTEELFPKKSLEYVADRINQIDTFLSYNGVKSFNHVNLETEMLTKPALLELEQQIIQQSLVKSPSVNFAEISGVPAQVILLPSHSTFRLSKRQSFRLGDRVVFVAEVGSVSCGQRGYVIGHEPKSLSSSTSGHKNWIYVMFDEPFLGGNDMDGYVSANRCLVVSGECLLNLSDPQPPLHQEFVPSGHLKSQLLKLEPSRAAIAEQRQKGINEYQKHSKQNNLLHILNQDNRNQQPGLIRFVPENRVTPAQESKPQLPPQHPATHQPLKSAETLESQLKAILQISDKPELVKVNQVSSSNTPSPASATTSSIAPKPQKKPQKSPNSKPFQTTPTQVLQRKANQP